MATVEQRVSRRLNNRENFAKDMAARTKSGQRLGMFSHAMSLTIGDGSTDYQKDRRPSQEIGKLRNFSNQRGKLTTTDTFSKLQSNAIGDEFVDPGQYFLRKGAGSKSIGKCFRPSGGHKLTKHSEFVHLKEYDDHKAGPRNIPVNFMARSTSESFQKKTIYTEDAYERKEDMRKLDYQRRAALILDKNKPYTTSVYQHGTFDSFRKTYGNDGDFPEKPKYVVKPPSFGPFKIGNLPKQGYNKTIGANHSYIEDPLEDTVAYQKDVRGPIWRDPTHSTTTPWRPISTTYKNTSGMLNQ